MLNPELLSVLFPSDILSLKVFGDKNKTMAEPQWKKLEREQAHRVLDQLGAQNDTVVFSRNVTEVSWRDLPFYSTYRLCRLVNYATMPTFTMLYLSNGQEYVAVDGTPGPIYAVNRKDPIALNESNIISYLEFFFVHVAGADGDVFLIKDPARLPFMDSLDPTQQQTLASCFQPLRITRDALGNFEVPATLYYGGGLMRATILITPEGRISFHDQSLLLSGIHFPANPDGQTWLEE